MIIRSKIFLSTINRVIPSIARVLQYITIFIVCVESICAASLDTTSTQVAEKTIKWGPYCGVFSLYAGMNVLGLNPDITELIKPEYITTSKGSSLLDLSKAAKDQNLYCLTSYINISSLQSLPYLAILNVKTEVASQEYDHYELFLGVKDGQVLMYNPPLPIRAESFQTLAARWNGAALIFSNKPIDKYKLFLPVCVHAFGISIMIAVFIGTVYIFNLQFIKNMKYVKQLIVQCATIVGLSVIIAISVNLVPASGMLSDYAATTHILYSYSGAHAPIIDRGKAESLVTTEGVIFLDARLVQDYRVGHIPNAINVPINSDEEERKRIMSKIPKSNCLVIYCQSAFCPFAKRLASSLAENGYTNMLIYKGGWNEWKQYNPAH